MNTYLPRQVNEHGLGYCIDCMELLKRITIRADDRLTLGKWDQAQGKWLEHDCPRKSV